MLFNRSTPSEPGPTHAGSPPDVPTGQLIPLETRDIKPSPNNPRLLFDPDAMSQLKKSIAEHGVLVPITVYRPKGQSKYSILDGERRYRCCRELEDEGNKISIPANVVSPPTKVANLLYMFSIHNLREQWELMPTALGLRVIMKDLGETDTASLYKVTGLSTPQIERCKILLTYPEEFQNMSLDPDQQKRIPSNFWIEAYPVLDLCEQHLPELVSECGGRHGITRRLVSKYRAKTIRSVIHFRRICEAFDLAGNDEEQLGSVATRLRDYIAEEEFETRAAFDEFVEEGRELGQARSACDDFLKRMNKLTLEHLLDHREELVAKLEGVTDYVSQLLEKLAYSEPPPAKANDDEH